MNRLVKKFTAVPGEVKGVNEWQVPWVELAIMSSSKMTALVGELYKVTTHFKLYTARLETETGIRHEKSVPYCPEKNGVAERFNRTVFEAARSSLHAKKLPLRLWAEAVVYAVYTLNRTLSSTGEVTPYQTWNGESIRWKLDPKGRERSNIFGILRIIQKLPSLYSGISNGTDSSWHNFLWKTQGWRTTWTCWTIDSVYASTNLIYTKQNRQKLISCQSPVHQFTRFHVHNRRRNWATLL